MSSQRGGTENNTEFQDRNADYLSEGRVMSMARGRGSLLILFFVVVATAGGVALCEGG